MGFFCNCARSSHPANDPRDSVNRDLGAVRDPPRRVGDAEHHRHTPFAPERREVRRAATTFGDDAGDARDDVAECGAGDARHEYVARRDATQLALAVDDDGASGGPAYARWMSTQTW